MKILLVEDSRATAMVTMARLESFGYEIQHAISGQLALEYFQKSTFDLILMDIEMPGMNGFETTTRIRALEGHEPWAWTPIILLLPPIRQPMSLPPSKLAAMISFPRWRRRACCRPR